ncbi:MAG: phosphotransferase [Acidobacteriia bacterium]|nr:phosphotransferase [Terriglobia bacterium]
MPAQDSMIPPEKIAAVERALREAFGVTAFEDVRKLTNILPSTLIFRIVLQGSPYLLRVILRADDPSCHFACMRAAADAGLAPRVRYTSVEDKIAITDFIEAVPFPRNQAPVRMAHLLRALHALPPFPTRAPHINTTCTFLLHKGPALDGYFEKIRAANILPPAEAKELFARHAQLAAIYPLDESNMVSCHNDLFKPDNVLFDGERLWLIDWEAAFLNDRYADLAVVANLAVTCPAEEQIFLREYFGEEPDEYRRARFYAAQQLAHMFYAMAFLFLGSLGKASLGKGSVDEPIDWSEPVPDFDDLQRRFWSGELSLADSAAKIAYGRVHWKRLQENLRQPRYEESLRIVSLK